MLKVKVKKGNIERALKEYKGKIIRTRQSRELNDRRYYTKPSIEKREEKNKAIYVEKKFKSDN